MYKTIVSCLNFPSILNIVFLVVSLTGVALTDSPAGLAAYILEKMAIGSNKEQTDTPHSGIESLDLDDVLDTVTIMWANNCVVTSMRIYAEGTSPQWPEVQIIRKYDF